MSEVKHTPITVSGWDASACGFTCFTIGGQPYGPTYVARAVNSHGDLVEALRLARKRLNGIFECSEDRYSATAAETAIAEIDEALSKVLELGEGL